MMPLILLSSGCIYLVVGSLGALGGYIISPDTVEGITEHDTATLWDAAVEVVSTMGTITEQQEEAGMIIANVNGTKVDIVISTVSNSTARIRVKARKLHLPKIAVAQDVFVKIMSYVNE
jgi:hypothetical protein